MPRVTLEWDENGIRDNVFTVHPTGGDAALAEDAGPPALGNDPGTGTAVASAGEDAGGPPDWLVAAISRSAEGNLSGSIGDDAGPAPT